MKNKLSEYVKIAEAAELLGMSQGTLRNRAEAGKTPFHKNPSNRYRLFKRGVREKILRGRCQTREGKTQMKRRPIQMSHAT